MRDRIQAQIDSQAHMRHYKMRMPLEAEDARTVVSVVEFHRLAQPEHMLTLPDLGNVLARHTDEHNDRHGMQRQQSSGSST